MSARAAGQSVFTVDLEEWYHANYAGAPTVPSRGDDRVVNETRRLLRLLDAADVRATFFVLGETAEAQPTLIADVAAAGHEIASHSYTHDLVYEMTREEFTRQAERSKALLESVANVPVVGFRAPSWSVDHRTPWVWDVLGELGYRYSSSLFPFRTFLYGDGDAPRFSHRRGSIWEIPPTTAKFGRRRVPFSGGFYLRSLPVGVIGVCARRVWAEGEAVMYYVHPREVDPDQPRLDLTRMQRLGHYYGLRRTEAKLARVLRWSKFARVIDLLEGVGPGIPSS